MQKTRTICLSYDLHSNHSCRTITFASDISTDLSECVFVSAGCAAAASHADKTFVFQTRCKVTSYKGFSNRFTTKIRAYSARPITDCFRKEITRIVERSLINGSLLDAVWEFCKDCRWSCSYLSRHIQETRQRAPLIQNWNLRRWR